uniref:Uncharacterized protein n=1 Tax=Anguilla anguilla TaxID=7936 RepID=A0A0E9QXS5_ANGAN
MEQTELILDSGTEIELSFISARLGTAPTA